MNRKKLPFRVIRGSWGNFSITVDKIENVRYSAGAWYCDAFTLSEEYLDLGYGMVGDYKSIGCSGCYQWAYAEVEKEYDTPLLPEYYPKHDRGLTYQKAGKDYTCFFCGKEIKKGEEYERYKMRSAGKHNMTINEVFCLGHRDEMREKFFKKPIDKIKFIELIEIWDLKRII